MASQLWTVQLEDGEHTIRLDHDKWTRTRSLYVDGIAQTLPPQIARSGLKRNVARFQLGGHEFALPLRHNALDFVSELIIDGRSAGLGSRVAALNPIPRWVWFFIIACTVIPTGLASGGSILTAALLGGLGGLTSSLCYYIARNRSWSSIARVATCTVIVAAWVALSVMALTQTASASKSWIAYSSPIGGFSVSLPGTPKETTSSNDTQVGSVTVHQWALQTPSANYMISTNDYPANAGQYDTAAMLEGAGKGVVALVHGTMRTEQEIALQGIPGRSLEIDTALKTVVRARIYMAKNRLYAVLIETANDQSYTSDADKFLDSFRLPGDRAHKRDSRDQKARAREP